MHRLLDRQLKKTYAGYPEMPKELKAFIDAVDEAYLQSDCDHSLVERSLELASQEFVTLNKKLKLDVLRRKEAEHALRDQSKKLAKNIAALATANKQINSTQESLVENEENLQNVMDALPLGIHMYELRGKKLVFTGANKAADMILGVKNAQFIGKTIEQAFPPLKKTEVPKRYREAAAKGKSWHTEQFTYANGKIAGAFRVTAFQTSPGRMAAAFEDITESKKANEALRKSKEMYSNLIETTKTGYLIIDPKGRILDANPEYVRMAGYKKLSEIMGRPVTDWTAKYDREKNMKEIIKCFKKGYVRGIQLDYVHKNGKIVPIEVNATVIKSKTGNIVISLCRDITEQKKATERFEALFESSRDAIMTLAPPSWLFTSGNPSTVEIFGCKNENDFTSRGPWAYSPKKQPDGQLSSAKAKKMIMKAMKVGSNFFEWTHKKWKGKDFPATVLLTRMTVGGKTFLQATVRDITKQTKSEEKLRESERKFRILFEDSQDGIFLLDEKLTIKSANKAATKILKKPKGSMIGKNILSLHKKADHKRCITNITKALKGKYATCDCSYLTSKNKLIPSDSTLSPITLKGKSMVLVSFRDVTVRNELSHKLDATNYTLRVKTKEMAKTINGFAKANRDLVAKEQRIKELEKQLKHLKK